MAYETEMGKYTQDASGLWHYEGDIRDVAEGAADAVAHRPPGPAWFWWSGSPVPILCGDTAKDLAVRWGEWRSQWHEDPESFLYNLRQVAEGA